MTETTKLLFTVCTLETELVNPEAFHRIQTASTENTEWLYLLKIQPSTCSKSVTHNTEQKVTVGITQTSLSACVYKKTSLSEYQDWNNHFSIVTMKNEIVVRSIFSIFSVFPPDGECGG